MGESRLAEKNEFIKNGRAAGRHNSNYCIVLTKLDGLWPKILRKAGPDLSLQPDTKSKGVCINHFDS